MIAAAAQPRTRLLPAVTLVAWGLVVFEGRLPILPALCGGAGPDTGPDWSGVPDRLDGMLRLTSPTQLLLSWAIMLAAMMLPLLHRPLAGIRGRGAAAGFVLAYAAVWMPAIGLIALASMALALATQVQPVAGMLIASGIAAAWQGSAIKAQCLRRCHDIRATGGLADGAAFAIPCIGACWAAMLLPYLAGPAHLPAMAVVTASLVLERQRPVEPAHRSWLMIVGLVLAGVGAGMSLHGGIDGVALS